MSNFARKATFGAVAFAMVGSTVFGGAALAGPWGGGDRDDEDAIAQSVCSSQATQTSLLGIVSSSSLTNVCNPQTVVF